MFKGVQYGGFKGNDADNLMSLKASAFSWLKILDFGTVFNVWCEGV